MSPSYTVVLKRKLSCSIGERLHLLFTLYCYFFPLEDKLHKGNDFIFVLFLLFTGVAQVPRIVFGTWCFNNTLNE